MRILVTGATGFVGRPLVKRLLATGHAVTALTREVARARLVLPVRCRLASWDPETGTIDPTAFAGVDAIVHLAGEGVADRRWTRTRKAAVRESRVAGTRLLVRAVAALPVDARPRALVAASAIGYYGDRGDESLDEDAPSGHGFLAEVCRAWEHESGKATALGVRTVALRIGVVLGRDGGALRRVLPLFRLAVAGRLGSGRQWMSWIHLDDLVELLVFALERPALSGAVNGVAPEPVTNAAFTATLAQALGRPAFLAVPKIVLRAALGEMADVLLASQRVVPRVARAHDFRFRHADLAGALADLVAIRGEEVTFEQWVRRDPAQVFPFFSDAQNLERITPEFLRFRVLRMTPLAMAPGTRIDYRLRLHGIPLRWQSHIEAWEPGRGFVDSQVRGPYRRWHHTHEFEPCEGGTLIRDRVRYELPLGALGELVAGGLVARDVASIFAYRRTKVDELLG